jgi:enediyne biosynthesis protein E4
MTQPKLYIIILSFLLLGNTPFFEDVSDDAGIQATHRAIWDESAPGPYENGYLAAGQAWGDFDNDGWVDLFVTGNLDPNILYHNNQDGTFSVSGYSDVVSMPNIPSGGAVWADYDNDGWRDLYILSMGENQLFHNLEGNGFENMTASAGVGDIGKGTTAAWGDYDLDGHLDLYVANWSCLPECELSDFIRSRDVLYHNNGDGTFTDVSGLLAFDKLLGAAFSVSFVDYDNDRDLDIYIVNDKAVNPLGNVLWRNDGEGCQGWCWADVSAESGADTVVHAMGLATGDYDNDGDLDFYFSNMVQSMVLLQNQGDGTFENLTEFAGVDYSTDEAVGWGTAFFDFDNDGWLDLYLASTGISPIYGKAGMHFQYPDMLYHNNGDRTFTPLEQNVFMDETYPTMGMSTADYNKDGLVDFIVTHWNDKHRLYQNSGYHSKNNWIAIQLEGHGDIARDALGTRIYVEMSDGRTQMQEVKSGSSLGAGNDTTLHFGLGETTIKRIVVDWLGGEQDEYTEIMTNQFCVISSDGSVCDS